MPALQNTIPTAPATAAVQSPIVAPAPEVVPSAQPKLTYAEKLAAKVKTLEERILKDKQALTEARLELESLEALGNIGEGNHVQFKVGKGESAKEVVGVVSGVKVEEDGSKLLRVLFGSGFDASSAVIKASQVLRVITQSEPVLAAEPDGQA